MSETKCDLCGYTLADGAIRFSVDRYDQQGYFDQVDVCSCECLATLAIGTAHERGEAAGMAAAVRTEQPKIKRKWWQR